MDDVILITLMRRKTNMISSRQIVEIINEEIKKVEKNDVRNALQKVKDRIEFLEELEFVHQHKQPVYDAKDSKAQKETAEKQFNEYFK
tara:strand:+ start:1418 stop:1681 length:264 start_codon:yes stop_codon:yes gene_type:complete